MAPHARSCVRHSARQSQPVDAREAFGRAARAAHEARDRHGQMEARHCAISYFIAAGLDWKQIST